MKAKRPPAALPITVLGNGQELAAESLADDVKAADMVPGEDADYHAAYVQNCRVYDVHRGYALEADKGLDDEDDAHNPGHDGDVDANHGCDDVGRGLRLHGEQDAVDDEHDDHDDHAALLGIKAELKGLGHGVGAVVAGHTVELADGEYEDEHAQGLAPVGPRGRETEAERSLRAADGARAGNHFAEHREADENGAELFFAYEEAVDVVAGLGAGTQHPADQRGYDYIADNHNQFCHCFFPQLILFCLFCWIIWDLINYYSHTTAAFLGAAAV